MAQFRKENGISIPLPLTSEGNVVYDSNGEPIASVNGADWSIAEDAEVAELIALTINRYHML